MNLYVSLAANTLMVLMASFASTVAWASCDESVGGFASVQNTVQVLGRDGGAWRRASVPDRLCEGDTIRVGPRGRAAVRLVNDAVLRLDQNTTMRLLNVSAKV